MKQSEMSSTRSTTQVLLGAWHAAGPVPTGRGINLAWQIVMASGHRGAWKMDFLFSPNSVRKDAPKINEKPFIY